MTVGIGEMLSFFELNCFYGLTTSFELDRYKLCGRAWKVLLTGVIPRNSSKY